MNHKKFLLALTLSLCALLCMAVTASANDHSDHPLCEGTECTDPAHNGSNHGSVTFEKVLTSSDGNVLQNDSPRTADPGVLLYAGLALTSLAGLTYTAKKRH